MSRHGKLKEEQNPNLSGRRIVFIFSSERDPYWTHRLTIENYSRAYSRFGAETTCVDLNSSGAAQKIVEALNTSSSLAAHCEQSSGLRMAVDIGGGRKANLFEAIGKPAISHIRDYPFYPWLREYCFGSHRNFLLSFTDRSCAELVNKVNSKFSENTPAQFTPHVCFRRDQNKEVVPWRHRPISLLYVGSFERPEIFLDRLKAKRPKWFKVAEETIECALDDLRTPLWKHGENAALAREHKVDYFDDAFTDFLYTVNQFVRNKRREDLLQSIAKHPAHIIWSGPKPEIAFHPDTVFLETNTFADTIDLMGQTKAMVMSLNSFPASLSERLLTAMDQGAVVVAQTNSLIDEIFEAGRDIITFERPDHSLSDGLELLSDQSFAESLTYNAKQKVEESFTPDFAVRCHAHALLDFERSR